MRLHRLEKRDGKNKRHRFFPCQLVHLSHYNALFEQPDYLNRQIDISNHIVTETDKSVCIYVDRFRRMLEPTSRISNNEFNSVPSEYVSCGICELHILGSHVLFDG